MHGIGLRLGISVMFCHVLLGRSQSDGDANDDNDDDDNGDDDDDCYRIPG